MGAAPHRLSGLEEPARALLAWYEANKRDMPWRGTDQDRPDPYHVWVSEIMLQQTRVEAVRGYFVRFVAALPDISALAQAPEDTLLKLWEGLGYYSRARNLQRAARVVTQRHGGKLPADVQQLRALPGIGEYTAGAIASMAFGIPVAAPDGNVFRVLSRLLGSAAPVGKSSVKTAFAQVAAAMIPPGRPGDFNQALMELGALICLPNAAPRCHRCPWQPRCAAHAQGSWATLPVLPPKKPRRVEERTVVLVMADGALLLRRRPPKGLLAGLPEPLNREGVLGPEEIAAALTGLGGCVREVRPLGRGVHLFSHVEWRMEGFLVHTRPFAPPQGFFWATEAQLEREVAIPAAFRVFMDQRPGGPGADVTREPPGFRDGIQK